jgi:hypothetical protein
MTWTKASLRGKTVDIVDSTWEAGGKEGRKEGKGKVAEDQNGRSI